MAGAFAAGPDGKMRWLRAGALKMWPDWNVSCGDQLATAVPLTQTVKKSGVPTVVDRFVKLICADGVPAATTCFASSALAVWTVTTVLPQLVMVPPVTGSCCKRPLTLNRPPSGAARG